MSTMTMASHGQPSRKQPSGPLLRHFLQPVQHSVMTASSLGFFLRAVTIPLERGSCFISSGTIPGAFATCGSVAMTKLYLRSQDFVTAVLFARLPKKDAKQPAKPAFSAGFHL